MSAAELLRDVAFFKGLESAHLDVLERCASEQRYAAGRYLLRQNQEIDSCLILCQGRVVLETCDTRSRCTPIQTLEAGAVLGWSWLTPPYHSFFDARALEEVQALALACAPLRAAMEADHEFGYQFLKRAVRPLMSRLQSCRLQMADVYAHPGRPPA